MRSAAIARGNTTSGLETGAWKIAGRKKVSECAGFAV
jgi:hypothetical protein